MNFQKSLVIIVGPTAIGKTDLAIKVAQYFNTEIISADSRQFYQEMKIGTAKPSATELAAVKHHFINSHSVTESFSVGDYEEQALALIERLFLSHDQLILVGGSGLFIKAITDGFDTLPKAEEQVREELNLLFETQGLSPLRERLKELDPVYYAEVDLNNPQRIIRALEVCISSGKSFSSYRSNTTHKRNFSTIKIGLNTDRAKLYQSINQRVDLMMDAGLVEEVSSLIPFKDLNALNTVGYSELFEYLDGNISLHEAGDAIKQNTRRFAKRQLTWFRKDVEINWFEPNESEEIIRFIKEKAEL